MSDHFLLHCELASWAMALARGAHNPSLPPAQLQLPAPLYPSVWLHTDTGVVEESLGAEELRVLHGRLGAAGAQWIRLVVAAAGLPLPAPLRPWVPLGPRQRGVALLTPGPAPEQLTVWWTQGRQLHSAHCPHPTPPGRPQWWQPEPQPPLYRALPSLTEAAAALSDAEATAAAHIHRWFSQRETQLRDLTETLRARVGVSLPEDLGAEAAAIRRLWRRVEDTAVILHAAETGREGEIDPALTGVWRALADAASVCVAATTVRR